MKKRKNYAKILLLIVAVVAILSMIFSSVLIGMDSDEATPSKYNDFRFQFQNGQWTTTINNYAMNFYSHPAELEDIEVPNPENLNSPLIYVTFDPNATNEYIALSRLKLDLTSQLTNIYFSHGILDTSEEYDLPITTCQNASAYIPVIKYQESNETYIDYNNNCYILNAQSNIDYLRLTERIIYHLTGVING
ncbi:MAG: hypothetical protein KAT77_05800 [Nanoarchaeota archaeon]|nr:hypothetical protein [Nanoarchaeota archaeon]